MAYSSCMTGLGANIAQDCANPIVAGYTGEGILIDLSTVTPTYTVSGTNPRTISAITLESGDKVCVVDNVFAAPFDGSNTAASTDNGRGEYVKQLIMRVPKRGSDTAKDIIEPLLNNGVGYLGIFPKVDKVGNGSFEIIGYKGKFKATEQTRNEGENGGDWVVTMQATEPWAEVVLFDTNYATTKALYDALKAKAY